MSTDVSKCPVRGEAAPAWEPLLLTSGDEAGVLNWPLKFFLRDPSLSCLPETGSRCPGSRDFCVWAAVPGSSPSPWCVCAPRREDPRGGLRADPAEAAAALRAPSASPGTDTAVTPHLLGEGQQGQVSKKERLGQGHFETSKFFFLHVRLF